MILSLGDFVFELNTLPPKGFTLSLQTVWAKQNPFQSRPVSQYTGVKGEKLTVLGVIYPTSNVTGTSTELTELKDMALAGEPYVLSNADGYVQGEYTIESVEENHSEFAPGGVTLKIEFTIILERVDDGRTTRLPQQALAS